MKTNLTRLALLALPLVPLCPTNAAVNPAIVSADAKWMVYADLNVLRTSTLGRELIAAAEKAQFAKTDGKIGVDIEKVLAMIGSATAYGANFSAEPKSMDGTLIVQGTPDLRKIAESLLLQQTIVAADHVVELTDLPFPAYGIKGGQKKDNKDATQDDAKSSPAEKSAAKTDPVKIELFIAFPPEPIIIVSRSKTQLIKAREVFRGTGASLAKASSSPLKRFLSASDDSCLFAATVAPPEKIFPEDGPQARILKMATAGSLSLGEHGTDTFAHAELVASSDQMADKLMKILQGMTAMMSLAETSDKQLAEFLNSGAVNRNGDAVTLDLTYSSERLAQMVQNLQQQSKPQDRAAARTAQMINGKALAEWQAEPAPAVEGAGPAALASRTIENVALKNGTLLTLARQSNGGKNVRFDRVEIIPAEGAGASLVFRPDFMRTGGPRGNWSQFQFPGADGTYTLKVAYVNDPDGKAAYAVSVRDPKPPASEPEAKNK